MNITHLFGPRARTLYLLTVTGLTVGCTSNGPASSGTSVDAKPSAFTNGNFEAGSNGQPPPSWTVHTFLDPKDTGVTIETPQTRAGLNLTSGGNPLTIIKSTNAGPLSQPDSNLGSGASLRWPRYGNQAVLINDTGKNQNVNSITQTMTVASGDVDPSDGLVHIRFAVAPVLQNPSHPLEQQPYYFVQLTNVTKNNAVVYTDFNLSAQPGVPWKTVNGGTSSELDYTDWQLVDIAPGPSGLDVGDQVQLELMASGCSQGGHFGKLYVDGLGSTVPGLFVSGTAAPVAPACGPLTYTVTYHNGSAANETGVVVDFTTPPNTTYSSINAPAQSCTTPAVGSTGDVVCTVGNLAAGASGSFQVTVTIDCNASGTIVQGMYDVLSNEETALYGSHILTKIGCAVDADCTAGNWCNETTAVCVPKIANAFPVATDAAHTSPTLDGTCTAAAGALVCISGVCDTADDDCGDLNAHGPCTVANGGVVCRSGVCDGNDSLCGYADGDGPCTGLNAATVCRSGACSVAGTCKPAGGCNVDADCAANQWCNETQHQCTSKLPNGTAMPADAPHTNPTLDAHCSAQAGALVCTSAVCDTVDDRCGHANGQGPCTLATAGTVCRSAVCDTDLLCGYADGDGPCNAGNAATICRSGVCSQSGVCLPPGACNVDADCPAQKWCNEGVHTCTAKLTNGTAMPSDPPHTAPVLDATCAVGAATLVCQSAVCDTADARCGYKNGDGPCTLLDGPTVCRSEVCDPDLKCGYADGDGPCTPADGPVVCRSGACSANGLCLPTGGGCNVDADCPSDQWCHESTHSCSPKLTNGTVLPTDPPHATPTLDGSCTADAGALVCQSGVCDPADSQCGYANLDGPCTGANGSTVCRSGYCATSGAQAGLCVACVDDSACGTQVCNLATHTCVPVDPGTDGSTSTGGAVRLPSNIALGLKGEGGAASSSSAGGSGGKGGGGGSDDGVSLAGNGVFGCSTSPASSDTGSGLWVAAVVALVAYPRRRLRGRHGHAGVESLGR